MSVTKLTIKGFRGFSEEQSLRFAQPRDETGSGITILVGPNNGGKSTVIEALQAWSGRENTSFSEGKRNKLSGDRVLIRIERDGSVQKLKTIAGGSQTVREPNDPPHNCYVLPSRRFFNPYFGTGQRDRERYLRSHGLPNTRSTPTDDFYQRLFNALEHRDAFNRVLERVVNPAPIWTIDQSDQGQHYLKIDSHGQYHNSDGLGEGIVSLLFIVDALYDSHEGDLIAIDEPELSLHPAYQRRLAALLADYARDRQIVIATHSPYFVDFEHVLNGAEVARVHGRGGSSIVSQLKRETAELFEGVLRDSHNPHVLGLDAREIFFQSDGVVVVEGQEDVVHYPRVLDYLVNFDKLSNERATRLRERFFGWGAGGAEKIERVLALLHDLGFERVAGILDKNKCHLIPDLQQKFSSYTFRSIPADDVRTKPGVEGRDPTHGLLDENGSLRPEYAQETGVVFNDIEEKLHKDPHELEESSQ